MINRLLFVKNRSESIATLSAYVQPPANVAETSRTGAESSILGTLPAPTPEYVFTVLETSSSHFQSGTAVMPPPPANFANMDAIAKSIDILARDTWCGALGWAVRRSILGLVSDWECTILGSYGGSVEITSQMKREDALEIRRELQQLLLSSRGVNGPRPLACPLSMSEKVRGSVWVYRELHSGPCDTVQNHVNVPTFGLLFLMESPSLIKRI